MIDTDSQSSNSQQFLPPEEVDTLSTENKTAALFEQSCFPDPEKMVHRSRFERSDFIPASPQLERFDLPDPHKAGDRQFAMRGFLRQVGHQYQFVLFDTTPKMAISPTWNCLPASRFVVTPLPMEEESIQSVSGTDRVTRVAAARNPELAFLGYVVNMFDKRAA